MKIYTQLCNTTTGNGEYTHATAMRCRLSRFGPDPNPFVSNERGWKQIYINQRIGVVAIMNVNSLARQVGLEWWRGEIKAFSWDGYCRHDLPVTTMRSQLLEDIERLIGKTKGGGIQDVMSARRGMPNLPGAVTGLEPRTLDLDGLTRRVGAWTKTLAEQRVVIRCKTMFEGDAAAMSEMGVNTLRELLLHD